MWGDEEYVAQRIVKAVGALFPPNIASNVFNFTFAPAVELTLDQGLATDMTTSVVVALLTITFNAPVANFTLADVTLTGVTTANFTVVSGAECVPPPPQ